MKGGLRIVHRRGPGICEKGPRVFFRVEPGILNEEPWILHGGTRDLKQRAKDLLWGTRDLKQRGYHRRTRFRNKGPKNISQLKMCIK